MLKRFFTCGAVHCELWARSLSLIRCSRQLSPERTWLPFLASGLCAAAAMGLICLLPSKPASAENNAQILNDRHAKLAAYDLEIVGENLQHLEIRLNGTIVSFPSFDLIHAEQLAFERAAELAGTKEPIIVIRRNSRGAASPPVDLTYVALIATADGRLLAAASPAKRSPGEDTADSLEVMEDAFADFDSGAAVHVRLDGQADGNRCFDMSGHHPWACDAGPPPTIHLRHVRNTYVVDTRRMRKPPLAQADLARRIASIRIDPQWLRPDRPVPMELISTMTALIYSGNVDQAMLFLNAAWPEQRPDMPAFLHSYYICRVKRSRYWSGVAPISGLSPAAPETETCPARDSPRSAFGWVRQAVVFDSLRISVLDNGLDDQVLVTRGADGKATMRWHGRSISILAGLVDVPWHDRKGVRISTQSRVGGNDDLQTFLNIEGGKLVEIVEIGAGRTDDIQFADIDGLPGDEALVSEAAVGGSVYGYRRPVAMRLDGNRYRIDSALMRKPPLSVARLQALAKKLRDQMGRRENSRGRDELQRTMYDLTYSGNADQARDLAGMVWPQAQATKGMFMHEFFYCDLASSRYWPAIAAMNGLPVAPLDSRCPYPF